MTPDASIAAIAAGHHGIISMTAARSCGLSERQIHHRVSTGRWERLHPGVYRIAGHPGSQLQQLAAAVEATRGAASHRSAAAASGLLERFAPTPEVTVGPTRGCRLAGIRVHRTNDLLARDLTTIQGIRCTNATRTLIDLGARLTTARLERVVESALHRRLVHLDPLVARFLQLARPGRTGISRMRAVLAVIDPAVGPSESDLETRMTALLRDGGLPEPIRQHQVVVDGRSFRLDMAYPGHRLAIECDGFAVHGTREAFESDRERQNLLMTAGWCILRFTWRQICHRPEAVLDQVALALSTRSTDRLPGSG